MGSLLKNQAVGTAESAPVTTSRLTREQVVDRIMSLNPTASREFLEGFEREQLVRYMDHLTEASKPRGREAKWRRPGDAPPMVWRYARR